MQITFTCPNCQTNLEIAADNMGTDIECPSCGVAVSVPNQEPGPGTTLGGFYLKSLIGVGGMGNVFLATQLSMDRDVALKVLSAAVTRYPEDLERFMNEVRMTAKLEHPNIVSAYEAGEDNGYYYMAIAYVNGLPLDQRINNSKNHRLEEKESLQLIKKIALALAYAWNEHGMLHRDVKPENILLDTNGQPKLADFGLSRSHDKSKRITSRGTIMGTPNYMSPEQMDDLASADKRSDIYSLGATLYQMLTGKIPFDGQNILKTFKMISSDSLADPRKYNTSISLQCIKLLEKMLAREPEDRYQTWKDVLSDINLILHNKKITRPRLAAGKSVIKAVVRKSKSIPTSKEPEPTSSPAGKIGVLLVVVVVLVGLVFGLGQMFTAQKEKEIRRQRLARESAQKAAVAEQEAILRERYDDVVQYLANNSDNYNGCVVKLKRALKSSLVGTIYEDKIRQKLAVIISEHDSAVTKVWKTLNQHAQEKFDAGKVDEAIRMLRSYTGRYAVEIKEKRYAKAIELEEEAQKQVVNHKKNSKKACIVIDTVLDSLADALIDMDFDLANNIVAKVDSSYFPEESMERWKKIKVHVAAVTASRRTVVSSFFAGRRKIIKVALKNGDSLRLRVIRISENTIYALNIGSGKEFRFDLSDLSEIEYFRRLGSGKSAGLEIVRGILSHKAGLYASAQKYFISANCELGGVIAEKTKAIATIKSSDATLKSLEQKAQSDYCRILRILRLEYTRNSPEKTINALTSASPGKLTLLRLKKELFIYNSKYKDTKFLSAHIDVLKGIGAVTDNK